MTERSQESTRIKCCDSCADKQCCEVSDMLKCDEYLHHIKKIWRGLL